MPDLTFRVSAAKAVYDAKPPSVALLLDIDNRVAGEIVDSINLRCQIQIETPRRSYSEDEQVRLADLFGEPARWGQTLRPLLWSNLATTVGAFAGTARVRLMAPCPFDLESGVRRYFDALSGGAVPITLLFSGTVFYETRDGRFQAAPISWNSEARFAFPVDVWKESTELAMQVGRG